MTETYHVLDSFEFIDAGVSRLVQSCLTTELHENVHVLPPPIGGISKQMSAQGSIASGVGMGKLPMWKRHAVAWLSHHGA